MDRKGRTTITFIVTATIAVMLTVVGMLYLLHYLGIPIFPGAIKTEPVAKTPEGEVISPTPESRYLYETGGKLKITFSLYNAYNDTEVTKDRPTVKIYHSRGKPFDPDNKELFGTMGATSTSVTGELWISDAGKLYMVIDTEDEDDWYLYTAENTEMQYVVESEPKLVDADGDGTFEYLYTLDVTPVPKLEAGESQKEITIVGYVVQYGTPALKSDYNVSDVSTSSWNYHTASVYVDLAEGYGFKFTKVWLDLSGGNHNHTLVDNNSVQIQYIRIVDEGGETYLLKKFTFDKGAKEIRFDLSDYGVEYETEESNGLLVFRDRNEGTRWCRIELRIKAKFDQADGWMPNLKIQYIKPDGSQGTISQLVKFSNS